MKLKTGLLAMLAVIIAAGASGAEKPKKDPVKFAFGIHTGIDIGGAVPWPPGNIMGENKMSATPHLNPMIGLSYTTIFDKHWSLTVEGTYKTVSLDAKAWVEKQRFDENKDDGSRITKFFRGSTNMEMSFTMIEVPFFLRYSFSKGNNRILLGGYYSFVMKNKFVVTPQKGLLFSADADGNLDESTASDITPETRYTQEFTDYLDNWDAGILIGYERRIINRITVSGRFTMGFKDIFKKDSKYLDYKMLNMRGTVILSYQIFRK